MGPPQKTTSIGGITVVVHRSLNTHDLNGQIVTAPTYVKILLGGNYISSDVSYCCLYDFTAKLKFRGDESHLIFEVLYAPGPFGTYCGTVGICYLPVDFLTRECSPSPFHGSFPLVTPLGSVDEIHKMELLVTISVEQLAESVTSDFVLEAHRSCSQIRISPMQLDLNTFPERASCCDWQSNMECKASSLCPYVIFRCGVQSAQTPTAYTTASKDHSLFLFPPKRDISMIDRCCCCSCCAYPPYAKKRAKYKDERIPGYRKEINDADNHMVVKYQSVIKNLWYLHTTFLEIEVKNNNFLCEDHDLCTGLIDFDVVFHEVYFGEKFIKNEELEIEVPLFVDGHQDAVGKITIGLELLQDAMAKGEEDSRLLWELSEASAAALANTACADGMVRRVLDRGPADAQLLKQDTKLALIRILAASAINVLRTGVEHEDDVNVYRRERLAAFVEQLVTLFSPPNEVIEELDEAVQNLIPPMNAQQCREVWMEVEPEEDTRLREFSGIIVFFVKNGLDAFVQRVLTVATYVICSESKSFSTIVFSSLELEVGIWLGNELNRTLADDPNVSIKLQPERLPPSEGIVNTLTKTRDELAAKNKRTCLTGCCGENEMPTPPLADKSALRKVRVVSSIVFLVSALFGLFSAKVLSEILLEVDNVFFCDDWWQKFIPIFKTFCRGFRHTFADERLGYFLGGPVGLTAASMCFGIPRGYDAWKRAHERWSALQEFGWEPLMKPRATVHKWICASGFLKRRSEIFYPWRMSTPWTKDDTFCVRFATENLLALGEQLDKTGRQIKRAALAASSLLAVSNPISLSQFCVNNILNRSIDLPLVCAENQALLAGAKLATRIMEGPPGVSLAAYGSACHLVLACLHELRRRNLYFFIKDVILMGASYPSHDANPWRKAREVVSGRMINAYKPDDAFLRAQRMWIPGRRKMAGVHGAYVPGIENINISNVVAQHEDYPTIAPAVMQYLLSVREAA